MWMALHDGYMLGTHWLRPNMSAELQLRATCAICGECETMTHVLLECRARGQEDVWRLLKDTWALTGTAWKEPCWGTTIGAACAVFKTPEGNRRPAIELWCILCTEALHLVWKLRCERVIQKDGAEFTLSEITNRYYATMDSRLLYHLNLFDQSRSHSNSGNNGNNFLSIYRIFWNFSKKSKSHVLVE